MSKKEMDSPRKKQKKIKKFPYQIQLVKINYIHYNKQYGNSVYFFDCSMIVKNWNFIFYVVYSNFSYALLSIVFHLQKIFYGVYNDTVVFYLFFLQKDFDIFHMHIFAFVFFFFRKILIPFTSHFLKPYFVFLIVFGRRFICVENCLINFSKIFDQNFFHLNLPQNILYQNLLYQNCQKKFISTQ